MRIPKIVLSFCLVLLLSSFRLSAYAGYDTPLDLVSSYADSHYGSLEADYLNGNKHIAIFSGGWTVGLQGSASIWVDLDDYNAVSQEGGASGNPDDDWVTVWVMATGSFGGIGLPVSISIAHFPIDVNYPDPKNVHQRYLSH